MSDTILSGDITVYYLDDNRKKYLRWTGSATGTRTLNEVYSALQDLFDEPGQMEDGIPISAQTPVEYTIGAIDSGDADPWYFQYELVQHLTGGAIKTASWARVQDSNAGIIVVKVAGGGTIVAGDVGYDISGATTGAGTLLEFIDDGTFDYLVIRPDDSTAAKNFTTASQTITCSGHTASQSAAGSTTGEQIWPNLYSIGTIEADTHVYVYQGAAATDAGRVRITSITDATADWWSDGHIDMLLFTKSFKGTPGSYTTIDGGYASVLARKGSTLYDYFEVATSLTSGGRNPIPLATAPDLNNTTGYRSVTLSGASGNWSEGDEIHGSTSDARGIITLIENPGATPTLHYVLLGGDIPMTDFSAAETCHNNDDTGTGTVNGAPASQGPALASWFTSTVAPTISFGYASYDIDNDGNEERYGMTIDCNANPLSEVYEWLKYITRQGATGTTNTDGIPGELYVGGEVYLKYSGSVSGGTIDEGDDVVQATSGATGIVISHDTANKILLLRSKRGTFSTAYAITSTEHSGSLTPDTSTVTFSPQKSSPFGTFAGGTYFGARGVLISDWLAADENLFQLTPVEGGTVSRPPAITIEVTNLTGTSEATLTDDRVAVFRLTGLAGVIDKTEYSAAGGESIGDGTLVVDGSITQDTPGKTTGGILRIRDASVGYTGYRIRYSSWSGSTFTLPNYSFAATASTDTTNIYKSGGGFTANVKRGDLVLNTSRTNAVSYVKRVVSDTQIEIYPAITGQVSTDNIKINTVPIAMDTADDVFVPLVDKYADAASASVSVQYSARIDFRVVVRNNANATKILPFSTDDYTEGTNRSIATIRTTDTITT